MIFALGILINQSPPDRSRVHIAFRFHLLSGVPDAQSRQGSKLTQQKLVFENNPVAHVGQAEAGMAGAFAVDSVPPPHAPATAMINGEAASNNLIII